LSGTALRSAIAALRAGRPIRIDGPCPAAVLAVETATQELLDLVDPGHLAKLLISGERAAALNLANERDAADPGAPVVLDHAQWLDAANALAIADPGRDLDRAPIGPLHPVTPDCVETARAALDLARSAPPAEDLAPLVAAAEADPDDLQARFDLANAQMAAGQRDAAADSFLAIVAKDRAWNDGAARAQFLKLLEVVGLEDPWVSAQRRRLSAILFT